MSDTLPKPPEDTRVLVVEDIQRLRDVLVAAIPGMGFPANWAASAEDAVKIMERDTHEIIVLDLNLPRMGGLEFFEMVRLRWPDTQVIVLTGFGDIEAAQRAVRLDVVDFLTKPTSLGDLEIALDRAYRRRLQSTGRYPVQGAPEPDPPSELREDSPRLLRDMEREHILAALDRNNGNRAATAAELGISLRALYYRLAEYHHEGVVRGTN